MAQKSSGSWFWLILGLLAGVALTLAALMFLNAGAGDSADGRTLADDAAAAGQVADVPALPAPVDPAARTTPIPPPLNAGIDPASDDQIADDAAASGMTSRRPAPAPDGE